MKAHLISFCSPNCLFHVLISNKIRELCCSRPLNSNTDLVIYPNISHNIYSKIKLKLFQCHHDQEEMWPICNYRNVILVCIQQQFKKHGTDQLSVSSFYCTILHHRTDLYISKHYSERTFSNSLLIFNMHPDNMSRNVQKVAHNATTRTGHVTNYIN